MIRKIDTKTAIDQTATETAIAPATEGYRAPELRSVGSAVKLVQGVGSGSYDQCGHSQYGC